MLTSRAPIVARRAALQASRRAACQVSKRTYADASGAAMKAEAKKNPELFVCGLVCKEQ
jgi:hypothetical protein